MQAGDLKKLRDGNRNCIGLSSRDAKLVSARADEHYFTVSTRAELRDQ